jgi:hypothetical protein
MSTINANVQTLSTMTGMSEVELQKRAQEMVAAGKVKGLTALEQQLVVQTTGPKQSTVEAFQAMGVGNAEPHALEEPAQVLGHVTSEAGFAPSAQTTSAGMTAATSPAALDAAAAAGQQRMTGFFSVSVPGQKQSGGSAFDAINKMIADVKLPGMGGDEQSRTLAMEQLKIQMNRIQESMNLLTNTLSQANETAKTAINNLRA